MWRRAVDLIFPERDIALDFVSGGWRLDNYIQRDVRKIARAGIQQSDGIELRREIYIPPKTLLLRQEFPDFCDESFHPFSFGYEPIGI